MTSFSDSIITPITAFLYPSDNITVYSYYVNDGGHTDANFTNTTSYKRCNINYGSLYQFFLLFGIYQVYIITQILFLMFMVEHYLQHIQIHQNI